MLEDCSDVMLAPALKDNLHRPLRLMCVILGLNEADYVGELSNIRCGDDVAKLFTQMHEACESPDLIGFGLSFSGYEDAEGVDIATGLEMQVGNADTTAFNIELRGSELMLYAGTYGLSTSGGFTFNEQTPREFGIMSHDLKKLTHLAITAFPAPPIGDDAIVRQQLVALLDYRPMETFGLEETMAQSVGMALDLIDAIRGVRYDEDASFLNQWRELSALSPDTITGEFFSELLMRQDQSFGVSYHADGLQDLTTELTFWYGVDDDYDICITVDDVGITVDMGFAMFSPGQGSCFEPHNAGIVLNGAPEGSREACIRLLDALACYAEDKIEAERRRTRRLVSSFALLPAAA